MMRFVSVATLMLLASCGGSSSNTSARTGVFLDSPVENLDYRTESSIGVTDSRGEYKYIAGESVVFSIGNLVLPEVAARSVITPLDLAGSTNINDSRVVNIIRLLQTLDVDGDPGNGIVISDAAKLSATPVDFSLSSSEFSNSTAVTSLIFNAGQESSISGLVSREDAVDHFEGQLNDDSFLQALDRTYLFNGEEKLITNPGINLDSAGKLQFNLKNNNLNPRHMIQVTTIYSSKQEFDNAFVNGTLVLVGDNVLSMGMEIDGRFNNANQNSFSVTVTAIENGTYDFVSAGTMNIPISTFDNLTCNPDQPNICSGSGSSTTSVTAVSRVVVTNIEYGER